MSSRFRSAVIMPNTTKQIDPRLIEKLLCRIRDAGCAVRVPRESLTLSDCFAECTVCETDEVLFEGADVIFVLGGDGSIIEAARRSVGYDIPIAGINFGRLGYLAEIEIEELALIDQILSGDAATESRMMLDVALIRDGAEQRGFIPALNDVVLSNGPIPRLLSFALHCDGVLAEECFADGMILSTPTGSSAYSLSAGGPILDPCLDCVCATPICPQRMNNRPVIFSGDSVLELLEMACGSNRIYLSIDGRESMELQPGDIVRISRSRYRTFLLRVKNGGFLGALRRKLSYNTVNGGSYEGKTSQ